MFVSMATVFFFFFVGFQASNFCDLSWFVIQTWDWLGVWGEGDEEVGGVGHGDRSL